MQTALSWLADTDSFSEPLGLPSYAPTVPLSPPATNAYVLVSGSDLLFTDAGSSLRDSLLYVQNTMARCKSMMANASSADFSSPGQMNIRLLNKLYANNDFNAATSSSAYYLQLLQSIFEIELVNSGHADLQDLINDNYNDRKSQILSDMHILDSNPFVLSSMKVLSLDDATIVLDIMQHSINNSSNYETSINSYMESLMWITKLQMLQSRDSVQQDVDVIQGNGVTVMKWCGLATFVSLALSCIAGLGIEMKSLGPLSDYLLQLFMGQKHRHLTTKLFLGLS